jgi:ESX secretion system ATPase EccB
MARQSPTKLHVSGYRFLVRRMEHALVRGDVRMLDDPLRAQSLSLIAGAILAVIIVAASAVLAFFRPPGTLGNAPIVMVRDSGALYVRIGDTVHPVLNLASARLIAGAPANPEAVSMSAISNSKGGPLVGIPGAPATIAPPLGEHESGWAVCDDATSTTVIAGAVFGDGLASGRSVLVTPRSESAATTYLLYDGWRAKVDLRNRAVVRALKLDGVEPHPVRECYWTRRRRRRPSIHPASRVPAHRARYGDTR